MALLLNILSWILDVGVFFRSYDTDPCFEKGRCGALSNGDIQTFCYQGIAGCPAPVSFFVGLIELCKCTNLLEFSPIV